MVNDQPLWFLEIILYLSIYQLLTITVLYSIINDNHVGFWWFLNGLDLRPKTEKTSKHFLGFKSCVAPSFEGLKMRSSGNLLAPLITRNLTELGNYIVTSLSRADAKHLSPPLSNVMRSALMIHRAIHQRSQCDTTKTGKHLSRTSCWGRWVTATILSWAPSACGRT